MYHTAILLLIIITALLVHWKFPRFILGSFLATSIATIITLAGAFLLFGAKEHEIIILAINVSVFALLISALIGFVFDKHRNREQYEKPKKTKIESAKDAYAALQVALVVSGIAMVLLALFHGGTPIHLSVEGLLQLGIVLLLHRRWRWALHLLVGYVGIAVLVLMSLAIAELLFNLGVLSPKEVVGTLFGTCIAGWLCFKGAFAYNHILQVESSKQESQPNTSLNADAQ